MHKRYGGQTVPKGSYWDFRNWKVILITEPGKILPGPVNQLYLQVNIFELILCIAAISISFIMFLPFIGFAVALTTVAIAFGTFLLQKVLANMGRQICKAEECACNFALKHFCKKRDKEHEDNLTMIVKAMFLALFFLAGALAQKLLLC